MESINPQILKEQLTPQLLLPDRLLVIILLAGSVFTLILSLVLYFLLPVPDTIPDMQFILVVGAAYACLLCVALPLTFFLSNLMLSPVAMQRRLNQPLQNRFGKVSTDPMARIYALIRPSMLLRVLIPEAVAMAGFAFFIISVVTGAVHQQPLCGLFLLPTIIFIGYAPTQIPTPGKVADLLMILYSTIDFQTHPSDTTEM